MCGINGIVSKEPRPYSDLISIMNTKINHRGPDASGIYIQNHTSLGHVRLSIIDLSEHSNQPFNDNNYSLIYNGEVYNYKELQIKHQLNCKTTSDTEVIFEGLKKVGAPFIEELNGMFCLAFFNKQTNETLIARDRIGIKPLYIFQNDDKYIIFVRLILVIFFTIFFVCSKNSFNSLSVVSLKEETDEAKIT